MPVIETTISYKRRRFCYEYLKDHNGLQAAKRAGYSPHTAGQQAAQMLADPETVEFLMALSEDLDQYLLMEAADVKNEIAKLAGSDIRGIYHEDGTIKMPYELDEITAAAVASFKVSKDKFGDDVVEYKFHPKMQALNSLEKQLNLHKDHEKESKTEVHVHLDDKDTKL